MNNPDVGPLSSQLLLREVERSVDLPPRCVSREELRVSRISSQGFGERTESRTHCIRLRVFHRI